MIDRDQVLHRLALRQGELTIREWARQEVHLLASWPPYPFPYSGFEFSFATMGPAERDALFCARRKEAGTLVLVVDSGGQPSIGYLGMRCVDWEAGTVGKVGVRVHPDWCGRGVGTSMLQLVTRWTFETGMVRWRLDVAASNARAVRCYEKVGFVRAGELWQGAGRVDLGDPRYDFLRPHLRGSENALELRFWVMELDRGRV